MRNKRIIAVTGGIGSGKSVVCQILERMGYPVYDCDSRAKKIMDGDSAIKEAIKSKICENGVDAEGNLDRGAIAAVVFSDTKKLAILNSIVHTAVTEDFLRWVDRCNYSLVFVETAILYQSGLDKIVDEVWEVEAPEELRIERVSRRNSLSFEEVKARIDSQRIEVEDPHCNIKVIINDLCNSLLIQIHNFLS